jgi:hypothetical protein
MILVSCTAILLCAPQGLPGAEPPVTPKLAEACRAGWLTFSVVSGRIILEGTRFGAINSTSSGNGRTERLNIQTKGSGPAVSYEMSDSSQRLLVDLSNTSQAVIQWLPQGNSSLVPVEYRQTEGKPVSLKIGGEKEQKTLEAASLWHLMIAYPEAGRDYLAPLVRVFQTDIDPAAFTKELETELTRPDSPFKPPSRQRWAELVQQLGSEQFAQREAADQELRKAGRLVVTYLDQLDSSSLDAEQQYRIRRIIRTLSRPAGIDTPGSTVAWLSGDPSVWLAMLGRDDEAVRRLALERLEGLLGETVAFDPKAERETRQQQLDQLRTKLLTR